MKPYFSVVMPTYGVDKYIGKAIESIQNQTYSNWELIIVNDCTPDKSAEIATGYAKQDSRIEVVHHEKNRGLSAARNTGIEHAKGEYIWFMDPDDFVDIDVLEKVYASIQKNPAEIIVFGLHEEYYDKNGALKYTHTICPNERLFTKQEELRKKIIYLEQQTLYGYAWNKIYQLEYLRDIRLKYTDVKLIEDIKFNVEFCMDIQRMNILAIAPYHYAKRMEGNLTNKFVPNYFSLHKERIDMIFHQYIYWELCTEEVRKILGALYGRYILSALQRNCDPRANMTHAERYMWCRGLFQEGLFNDLIPSAKAVDSKSLSVALFFLRWKKAIPCLVMGRGIYIAREKMPMLYSKIKSER